MRESIYLGRQLIVDADDNIFAYEILYRDSQKQSNVVNDRFASASVITSVLNRFGTRSLLGKRRAFVKIDEKFLLNDLILSIPNEFFVFSLLHTVSMNNTVLERVMQLRKKGYLFAINEADLNLEKVVEFEPLLEYLSFYKINIHHDLGKEAKGMIDILKINGIKIIGTKIETLSNFELAKKLGCDFFQGYFFAEPNILENAKYDPGKFDVIRLSNLLMQDTNIDEIATEFEKNHAITVQLLQFINSGAFHFRSRISSIHRILVLMGRIPVAQWLMLMIYSKSLGKKNDCSPLMLMVKSRTELMENLLKLIQPDARSNALGEAYFVGVLSLIDTIFGVKIEDILEQMYISDEIKEALLHDEGLLGELYALVRDIETFHTEGIAAFTLKYNLQPDAVEKVVIKSIEDVTTFEQDMSSGA
jgi:EAL and modified HD-GYP domain-containing signal transduction protein